MEGVSVDRDFVKSFKQFKLSKETLNALEEEKYVCPTDIQCLAIGAALSGKDVVASAITGSGKTLAYLIPILEKLHASKWSRTDGVGAVVITPTRELSYQIFETLKRVGKYHNVSAGLIIGGMNSKFETNHMDICNILICSPGRLLQHMNENPLFNADNLKILVLDEADRCLDMGFKHTINSIIENLPLKYQSLLYSATPINSYEFSKTLKIRNPIYVANKVSGDVELPMFLQQIYIVISLDEKITFLWSFLRNHTDQKIIVFLSTCKQVKYVYEVFIKLRPNMHLFALYGTLHQGRRLAIYNDFLKRSNAVLFATDIASRGLDFPAIHWVLQLDCPENVTQYVHRAGRCARNKTVGRSLLVLSEHEESGMIKELKGRRITLQKVQVDKKKIISPRLKIEALLVQNPEIKDSAKRAFLSYVKYVFLMTNKSIFKVSNINFHSFAASLGLMNPPRIRFMDRFSKSQINSIIDAQDDLIKVKHKKEIFIEHENQALQTKNFQEESI